MTTMKPIIHAGFDKIVLENQLTKSINHSLLSVTNAS